MSSISAALAEVGVEAARNCLRWGGHLTQALETLARVISASVSTYAHVLADVRELAKEEASWHVSGPWLNWDDILNNLTPDQQNSVLGVIADLLS
ncbi:hypothetical protein [Nonomuraea sp. NPDC023979]|uniref:hypothetical protein n=1 Tax=Nonomuraea sp. NPDC023979 TaxID=3154796 RepID=UPI0033F0687E